MPEPALLTFRRYADVDIPTFASWLDITPEQLARYEAGEPAPDELEARALLLAEKKMGDDFLSGNLEF